jgi:predicted MPP superfamily phosphohydrolase
MAAERISRREFLSRTAITSLGILLSPGIRRVQPARASEVESYDILIGSDTHIGYAGADASMEAFVTDVIQNLKPKDVFCLGDLVHNATLNEYQTYREFRNQIGVPVRECLGNHDHAPGLSNEDNIARFRDELGYSNHLYSYLLGNNIFIFLSDERQKNLPGGLSYAGYMEPEQVAWFEDTARANQDKNVIVLSHQSPKGTTVMSEQPNMQMHPTDEIDRILDTYRVDLWLSAHAHSGFDHKSAHADMFSAKGNTTFVQVASVCKCYNTNRVQSRLVSLVEGSQEVLIRSRDHEAQAFDESLNAVVSLPNPVAMATTAVAPEDKSAGMWGWVKVQR